METKAMRKLARKIVCLGMWMAVSCPGVAMAQACTLENGKIKAGDVCLVASMMVAPSGPGQPLALIVHGDGGGRVNDGYLKTFQEMAERIKASTPNAGIVFLQRPGYTSLLGRSEGVSKREDDDYTPDVVSQMAAAVVALRETLKPSRVVWVGHSGGSAIGALILGSKAGLIDAAVFAACPCGDIRIWRTNRNYSRGQMNASVWPNSLSPIQFQDALVRDSEVVLITGDKDDNTLPKFAETWVEKAKAKSVRAQLILLPGINHGGAASAPEVVEQASRLMRAP